MPDILPYDREAAIRYAHQWAYRRNPAYYDYERVGGDCTNFASQCLYAGTNIMNYTPTYGWSYLDANRKSPSWTGVTYFFNFMTRQEQSAGPFGIETTLDQIEPADFVQLRLHGDTFGHTPIVVAMGNPPTLENTLVAAHSFDVDYRPLATYFFEEIRFIHILGAFTPILETQPPEAYSQSI